MSLINTLPTSANNASNFIRNPFSKKITSKLNGPDFPEGFIIEELDFNGNNKVLNEIKLLGNMMPFVPFKFGGTQRVKKDYYPGYSEPVAQILGPTENNVEIIGEFKDKKYSANQDFYGVSTEIQELIDAIRIRGNLVRIRLGEWLRYGFIEQCEFELVKISRVRYKIGFSIVGFNVPQNAKFLERAREIPFDINTELISRAQAFQLNYSSIPLSVPLSIGDLIRQVTGAVASALSIVTKFIDGIVGAVNDIRKSVTRALGLIKYAQNKLREYKRFIGNFKPFDISQSLSGNYQGGLRSPRSIPGRYQNAAFYNGAIAESSAITSLLEKMATRLRALIKDLPTARHVVKAGDTLQSIAVKWLGTADDWKKIYDFNELDTTELTIGRVLEIPRN
jgi:LysM repeat protein